MKKEIPYRNKSPYGWWVAILLERYERKGEDKKNRHRRCTAYENTILIQAKNRDQAYRKALAIGKQGEGSGSTDENGNKGCWKFEGLVSLLPIYERLSHGSEILWVKHAHKTVKTLQSWVKKKKELEAFDDSPH